MIVLFVCKANLNRSPRAAQVFAALLKERGVTGVDVKSVGTDAINWPDWREMLDYYGVSHAVQLTQEMLLEADLIFPLDQSVGRDIWLRYEIGIERIARDLGVPDRFSKHEGNLDALLNLLWRVLSPIADEVAEKMRAANG